VRKLFFFLLAAQCSWFAASSQYWQQQVNYTIDVSLNDKEHTLDGFERIEYINHSPDTLHFIWFHLWPNAYKNDKTAFSDQLLVNGNTRFYFSDKEDRGYINRLDFKVNNITAGTEDHPQHIDIIKVVLPAPLAPGQTTIITTPFHVKLPYNLSRGGHDGESYQATQWYPKPAVYDTKGWHPIPYLDQGEFYSEFGTFDVSITVPENYAVAATGELQNEEEKKWLKERAEFTWIPARKKIKTKGGAIKTIEEKFPPSSSRKKTLRYTQDRVHDFAWFADKRFIVKQDTCILGPGKTVSVSVFYTQSKKDWRMFSLDYAKEAVHYYSTAVGEYPYNTLTVVQGPQSFGGGMEYPTITVISPTSSSADLELTINHEIGHNWFYGILASNEREYPWMDEGMTSYYTNRFRDKRSLGYGRLERAAFETVVAQHLDQPIQTSSEKFSERNYFLSSYYKAQEWLRYLESELGSDVFSAAMKKYYEQWKFKHPKPEDFQRVVEEVSGKDLDSQFAYLHKTGLLPYDQKKGTKFVAGFAPEFVQISWNDKLPDYKNLVFLGPAVGFNSYDKLMIGGMLTNLNLPPSPLQFFIAPMWGTGSKKLTGIGFVNYSFYPGGIVRKIDLGVSGAMFSENEFKKQDGKKAYFGFQKLAPGIRFTFSEKDPRSTMRRYIQWKTYFFNEEAYRVRYDSIFNPPIDTTLSQVVTTRNEHRTLHQLKIVIENYRALYPYSGELKIEQADDFIRAAFTGKYFFNYVKKGGLDVRFFAGKMFYAGSRTIFKTIASDRYHLNLTGANGYEDYTYSDYFLGRNKFEGFASQQIMVRDGAFKVRTDLLGDKVGKTDDWLIAANFSSSVPENINPLSLLPVKIPLKVFIDVGTYAEAWDRDANTDRFLFDAGLQIPLIKETVNIYVPLIYSRVFKDYKLSYLPKKGRFWKMISFSIDISNFSLRKFNRHLVF
jgi:hypothetical protein